MASIFVQLASYHDFELPKTIFDAMNKSSGEHFINFGIHHSYYEQDEIFIPNLPNIKKIIVKAPENMGVGKSRSMANSLYDGEDYYLQIDSHCRFDQNWDSFYIQYLKQYQAQGFEKPLLTTYPLIYSYNEHLTEEYKNVNATTISVLQDEEHFKKWLIPVQKGIPKTGQFQSSVSAGLIFSTGEFNSVGYNNKVLFLGEEILLAAMAWTRGFDLLIPDAPHIYHLYFNKEFELQRNGRRHMWKDFELEYNKLNLESRKEVADILSVGRIGDDALGTLRTLESFESHTKLDFRNRTFLID